MTEQINSFEKLNAINVNDHTEQKGNLTYLSWAWAWAEFKKIYPSATYETKKFEGDKPYLYDEKTGYMVFTKVTVDKLTHEMWLPVMDNRNKALMSPTVTDINKSIMRCLVKNLAMFGLGLYIYAGEDLPEGEQPANPPAQQEDTTPVTPAQVSKLMVMMDTLPDKGAEFMKKIESQFGKTDLLKLTYDEYGRILVRVKKKIDALEAKR